MLALNLLALKRLATRPLVVALSVAGIAIGVALVVSVNAVLTSVERSIEELVGIDEAASLTVTSRSVLGMPEDLVPMVAADPDVLSTSPQLTRAVLIDDEQALLIGRSDIDVVLAGSHFAQRSNVNLTTAVGRHQLDLAAAPAQLETINDGRVVLLPLALAQELLGQPAVVDTVALTVSPGTDDAVRQRLTDLLPPAAFVASADAPQQFALTQLEQVQAPLLFVATVALIAGGFLVFNTIQNSARQQERELAVLRALGASRRQVAAGLLIESAALGLIGAFLGVFLGQALGRFIVNALPVLVDSVAGTTVRYHADQSVLPAAVATGIMVALLSAIVPVRRVAAARPERVLARRLGSPSQDRPPTRSRTRTLVGGLVVVALGLAMSQTNQLQTAQNGIGVVQLGLLVAGWALADRLADAAGFIARQFGGLGSLVQADVGRAGRRVWGTTGAVFTAVMLALTVGGAARNQSTTVSGQFEMVRESDLWVATTTADDLPIGYYYPSHSAADLEALPGVRQAHATISSYGIRDNKRFVVFATDGPVRLPAVRLANDEAVNEMLSTPATIVTHQYARAFELDVGDQMTLDGLNGPVELRVAAITKTTAASKWGTVNMSIDTFTEVYGNPGPTGFEIITEPGTDHQQLQSLIPQVLGDAAPVVVTTGDEFFDVLIASVDDATNVFLIVTTAVVGVASIATLNATASSVVERRRQLGMLRSLGATRQQIRRLVCIEVFAAGLVGALAGLVAGNLLHRLAVDVTDRTTPFPEDYSFSWITLVHALGSAAIAIALGALIPAWQQGKSSVAEALAYE